MIGKTLGHYQIISKIGEGGMGVVYLAHDTSLGRKVAIKFLPEALKQDETARKRFVREARSAAALDHPYICSIHEVGEAEGKSFIVMEYLGGQTLRDRLAQGAVPLKEATQWAVEIAEALVAANEKGIIHRDLKPANIMLLQTGHAKVMDFGLAKQMETLQPLGSQEDTLTGTLTREGTTVGTLPYMSPEQILGKTVDHRSDLFSFGVVFYEMLTGSNPFKRDSGFETAEAILREEPVPVSKHISDVPQLLVNVIGKLQAKKPENRYQNAADVAKDLQKSIDEIFGKQTVVTRSSFSGLWKTMRKPVYLIPLILVLAVAAYFASQGVKNYQRSKWAREAAPKEVERLMEKRRPLAAARLLKEAGKYAPASKELSQLKTVLLASGILIQTTPAGADIYVKDYEEVDDNAKSNWELLGRSPFQAQQFPTGYFRFRIAKEGFETVEIAGPRAFFVQLRLHRRDEIPAGMAWVSAITKGAIDMVPAPAAAAEFWIDKYEVTNRQFKEFVDAGGYQKREYWKQPFMKDGRRISWEEAMAELHDQTGRAGPATWEFGTYPDGKADFPVGGVSWYEAVAYADFTGKSLPTIYHWYCAGGMSLYSDILHWSNFSGKEAAKIGTYQGLGDFGTYDMAGNLKEWCWNEVGGGRYILGGAWNEPEYQFGFPDARNPFERSAVFGFRCVKYTEPPPNALVEPLASSIILLKDRRKDQPADDQAFRIYLGWHSYDKTDLKPVVELVDETSSQYWRKEKISFQAAYGNERVIAELYLPKNAAPPYQTLLYFPGTDAFYTKALSGVGFRFIEPFILAGRAVIVPHYRGMLERSPLPDVSGRPDLLKEIVLHWSKDLGRSIDYLETRSSEIDLGKLVFAGVSLGAAQGPRLIAVEPRIKAGILALGGSESRAPAEIDSWNYASRVKIPILMLNGKSDFLFPFETSQIPLFQLLGTSQKDKMHLTYEGGHDILGRLDVFKDMLAWLDRYLGPTKMKPNQ